MILYRAQPLARWRTGKDSHAWFRQGNKEESSRALRFLGLIEPSKHWIPQQI
jgi:hypothetical protein